MMKLTIFACLVASAAAFAPSSQVRALRAAPVMMNLAPQTAPVRAISGAATAATVPAPALALEAGDLVLPVGGLTVLLTFILSLVIGYTVLGDGPANPTRKDGY